MLQCLRFQLINFDNQNYIEKRKTFKFGLVSLQKDDTEVHSM